MTEETIGKLLSWFTTLVGIVGGISGAIALVSQVRTSRANAAKTDAEAGKTNAETSGLIIDQLRAQIVELQDHNTQHDKEIAELRKTCTQQNNENEKLRKWSKGLCEQVDSLGGIPIPMPE